MAIPRFKVGDCADPDAVVVLSEEHEHAILEAYNQGYRDRHNLPPPLGFWQRFFTKAARLDR
jgi:hypothetical protein